MRIGYHASQSSKRHELLEYVEFTAAAGFEEPQSFELLAAVGAKASELTHLVTLESPGWDWPDRFPPPEGRSGRGMST